MKNKPVQLAKTFLNRVESRLARNLCYQVSVTSRLCVLDLRNLRLKLEEHICRSAAHPISSGRIVDLTPPSSACSERCNHKAVDAIIWRNQRELKSLLHHWSFVDQRADSAQPHCTCTNELLWYFLGCLKRPCSVFAIVSLWSVRFK